MKQNYPLLAALQEILPAIAANSSYGEKNRVTHPDSIKLLKSIKMHRAFQPKVYGGLEVSLPEFAQCVVAMSNACASTAWAFSLLCTHSHQIAMFPKKLQDEFWLDNPDTTASSSIAPFAKVQEGDGGVILNGEVGWSSGCDYAEWALVGFNRLKEDGSKVYCFAAIPRKDYEIKDDWFTVGMRGSGTKTLILKDVFVPEYRFQSAKDMMEGKSAGFGLYPESKIFYAPYRPYFASGFSAISLGIAERMLQVFKEKTQNRIRAYTGAKVGAATPALMRLAQSTHQVASARAFLEKTWQEHKEHAEAHQYPDRTTLTYWRTNQAYAVKCCIKAVDRLFEASGGGSWFEHNEMQKLFRDSHITGAHAYTDYDVCAQILGRELMGLEPDPSLL